MAKQSTPTKTLTLPPAPPPVDDDADLVITQGRKGSSDQSATNVIRKFVVNNQDATPEQIKAELIKQGHPDISASTIKMTQTATLAVLGFIKARKAGTKTTSINGASAAARYYMVNHPEAKPDDVEKWLKGKGVDASLSTIKSIHASTHAVMQMT